MKRRTLQQVIEQARRVRDDAAVRVAGASRAADQAQSTLETLSSYRNEHVQTAFRRPQFVPTVLRLHERFTRKLDQAIGEQTRVRDATYVAIDRRRAELIDRQQRLLAFETLQARRDSAQQRRRKLAEQRHDDEIAAQTFRRRERE